MTLADIVGSLDTLDADGTILAAEPWTPASQAVVINDAPDIVDDMTRGGMVYFIEVDIAREFRDGWIATGGNEVGLCERLIQYATNDA